MEGERRGLDRIKAKEQKNLTGIVSTEHDCGDDSSLSCVGAPH